MSHQERGVAWRGVLAGEGPNDSEGRGERKRKRKKVIRILLCFRNYTLQSKVYVCIASSRRLRIYGKVKSNLSTGRDEVCKVRCVNGRFDVTRHCVHTSVLDTLRKPRDLPDQGPQNPSTRLPGSSLRASFPRHAPTLIRCAESRCLSCAPRCH